MLSAATIINKLPGLKENDSDFLQDLMLRFPSVQQGFSEFVATPEMRRISKAAEIANIMPREGWKRFEIDLEGTRDVLSTHRGEYYGDRWLIFEDAPKKIETILEHSAEAAELYAIAYEAHHDLQFGVEVVKFHDFGEPVMNTDFKPSDPISREDKGRLEILAVELLTESRMSGDLLAQHIYNCIHIFEGTIKDFALCQGQMLQKISKSRAAGLITEKQLPTVQFLEKLYQTGVKDLELLRLRAKDIDSLHMLFRGTRILAENHSRLPEQQAQQKLEEFWQYVLPKLTQTESSRIYHALRKVCQTEKSLNYRQLVLETLQQAYNDKFHSQ